MSKFKVQSVNEDGWLKILVNGLPHVCVKRQELIGVQSWYTDGLFCIEYTTTTREILSEYDQKYKWVAILREVNKVLS